MKKIIKKASLTALVGVMSAGMLTGCGEKKEVLDGTKTVATVNETEIPAGLLSLCAHIQQAQTSALYKMYMGSDDGIWDMIADEETGETYGTQALDDCLEQLEMMCIMKEKAADYGVEISEEELTKISEAAAAFISENEETAIAEMAVTEDQVKEYLELSVYSDRVYNAILDEAEISVSEEEAQQSSFSYVSITTAGEELTEEDIEKLKEQAQEILDQMKADPQADMDEVAKGVDESLSGLTGTFAANPKEGEEEEYSAYPTEVLEVLRGLEDGQVADELIETEDSIYVVRLDLKNDEEATATEMESLEQEQRAAHYDELSEQWKEEAEISVVEEVKSQIEITDTHKYSLKQEEVTEETSEEELEVVEETEEE